LAGINFFAIDQTIKFVLVHYLKPAETIPVIKNVFHFTLVLNTGCAFGLFKDQPTLFFLIISFAAIILLIYFLIHLGRENTLSALAAVLLISGSASNLLDRFRFGYVIDFLDFRIWPVFNLGDTAITIGTVIFIIQMLQRYKART
jgi:signal peptidase II